MIRKLVLLAGSSLLLKAFNGRSRKPASAPASTGKQPMQADGGGRARGAPDGVSSAATHGRHAAGESGGGAYPNPHRGKKPQDPGSFLGHGGQTEMAYHGTGQLGETEVDATPNPNAPAKQS